MCVKNWNVITNIFELWFCSTVNMTETMAIPITPLKFCGVWKRFTVFPTFFPWSFSLKCLICTSSYVLQFRNYLGLLPFCASCIIVHILMYDISCQARIFIFLVLVIYWYCKTKPYFSISKEFLKPQNQKKGKFRISNMKYKNIPESICSYLSLTRFVAVCILNQFFLICPSRGL